MYDTLALGLPQMHSKPTAPFSIYLGYMKSLISDIGTSNSKTFSSIQSLTLSFMENLNCIANPPFHFPYLEHIYVIDFPLLKKLPFETEISKSRLKKIEGDQIWWDNLEWKDQSIKNFLTPHFIPIDRYAIYIFMQNHLLFSRSIWNSWTFYRVGKIMYDRVWPRGRVMSTTNQVKQLVKLTVIPSQKSK